MGSPIADHFVHVTVPITNEWGGRGTGFLLVRGYGEAKERQHILLVTNKHVIHRDAPTRQAASQINVEFTKGAVGARSTVVKEISLPGRVREHPDPDTDVLAVVVSDVVLSAKGTDNITARWIGDDLLAPASRRDDLDVSVGDEIVTIGYPMGRRQGQSALPLVRQGILSTQIGDNVYDAVRDGPGGVRDRSLRAFLFDGAAIPGSSGSPVVLKPVGARYVKGNMQLGVTLPVLLGIVAETTYAPISSPEGGDVLAYAGLGLAFEVETIIETLELFTDL